MKQILKITLVVLLMVAVLAGNVSADDTQSEFYEYAVKLGMLGLFRGTGTGFELDREPTRLEGAVMFVRLLGAEEEALEKDYAHPFMDVPQWGSPYVGYLYQNELTKGIAPDTFGSTIELKAISYLTFALRALGYSDDGPEKDFSWESALEFAYGKIIVDTDFYIKLSTAHFLREHVCKISYSVLTADITYSDNTLIEKLIGDGAVERYIAESQGIMTPFNIDDTVVEIGHTAQHSFDLLGIPQRNQYSRYGFDWNIYDSDYSNYIQVGIENDNVVGILSASSGYSYEKNISIGMTRDDVIAAYAEAALTEYRKAVPGENTTIIFPFTDQNASIYRTNRGNYITYFYDSYSRNKITAILVIDDIVEDRTLEAIPGYFDDTHYRALEIQVFGITNAFRVQFGLQPLLWDEKTRDTASLHSRDMSNRDYFSHISPEGGTLSDRLNAGKITYSAAGENIAFGYRNPVNMVNDWLNSTTGHREVMLGNYTYIGIGIWYNTDDKMFSTQHYWR